MPYFTICLWLETYLVFEKLTHTVHFICRKILIVGARLAIWNLDPYAILQQLYCIKNGVVSTFCRNFVFIYDDFVPRFCLLHIKNIIYQCRLFLYITSLSKSFKYKKNDIKIWWGILTWFYFFLQFWNLILKLQLWKEVMSSTECGICGNKVLHRSARIKCFEKC